MQVKVGKKWFNSTDIPIAIEFTDRDKLNIIAMVPGANLYGAFPNGQFKTQAEAVAWMQEGEAVTGKLSKPKAGIKVVDFNHGSKIPKKKASPIKS